VANGLKLLGEERLVVDVPELGSGLRQIVRFPPTDDIIPLPVSVSGHEGIAGGFDHGVGIGWKDVGRSLCHPEAREAEKARTSGANPTSVFGQKFDEILHFPA